jgi:hypothetical protein
MLSEREWEKFFELLDKIAGSSEGSWEERRDDVRSEAESRGSSGNLEEFVNWFVE